ncbi:MAG: AbrB/MazE/SpoVT family DNA-binding domain-containing protein [Clostridia bacterium]|nr:AbrB/MazE/SpoVT family DNA-binding domain-containing protein [Clostridia bacterium]MBR6290012.1 AbrB/MazE/SpoVT family DNA-binding domain-containing protein [Clostridia bacterium]
MKSLGIIRRVDELGRIVLPVETRKLMGLETRDGVEIFVEDDRIILKKYQPSCVFCGEADGVVDFKGKKVCKTCIEKLKNLD